MIEEANWLNLDEDLEEMEGKPEDGFDAVICLGNSFAHLPDFEGNQVPPTKLYISKITVIESINGLNK